LDLIDIRRMATLPAATLTELGNFRKPLGRGLPSELTVDRAVPAMLLRAMSGSINRRRV
jgi:hypothetical protein